MVVPVGLAFYPVGEYDRDERRLYTFLERDYPTTILELCENSTTNYQADEERVLLRMVMLKMMSYAADNKYRFRMGVLDRISVRGQFDDGSHWTMLKSANDMYVPMEYRWSDPARGRFSEDRSVVVNLERGEWTRAKEFGTFALPWYLYQGEYVEEYRDLPFREEDMGIWAYDLLCLTSEPPEGFVEI